jgi:hypothetical protein
MQPRRYLNDVSEKPVPQTTLSHILQDSYLHSQRQENFSLILTWDEITRRFMMIYVHRETWVEN